MPHDPADLTDREAARALGLGGRCAHDGGQWSSKQEETKDEAETFDARSARDDGSLERAAGGRRYAPRYGENSAPRDV
jgi:hypothetical protein